jgi:hypothetical protein
MGMIKYICDGCAKEADAVFSSEARRLFKPDSWFARADEDGEQHACSRECIKKASEKTGKTDLVLPV